MTEQKFISDCKYRVIESSSLVPVLFREVFSHPYISFFHLLVNGFSVIATCNKQMERELFLAPTLNVTTLVNNLDSIHRNIDYRHQAEGSQHLHIITLMIVTRNHFKTKEIGNFSKR